MTPDAEPDPLQPPPQRRSPRTVLVGGVLIALIVIAVVIVVSRGEDDDGGSAAAPLPDAVLGDWMLDGVATDGKQRPQKPMVTFKADGTWTGSDGCNGLTGTWQVTGEAIKTTVGPSTLIGCDNVPYGSIFFDGSAAVAGDRMTVQYDQNGTPATAVLVR